MSGRKCSHYNLERDIRAALQCNVEAQELHAQASAQVHSLEEIAESVPALQNLVTAAQSTLSEIKQQLTEVEAGLSRTRLSLPSRDKVQQHRMEINRLRRELDKLFSACRQSQTAASHRLEVAAMLHQLETQREVIRPWVEEAYDALHRQVTDLMVQSDEALRATGSASTTSLDIRKLSSEFTGLCKQAVEIRLQNEERHYVLEALQAVCHELGYASAVHDQKRPSDDLVIDVNTYSHGVIRFRLLLDGTIHSESEMVEASCGERFAVIEDKLRNIGVLTAFWYEGDQRPVRLERGAKSLPDDGVAASTQEAGR